MMSTLTGIRSVQEGRISEYRMLRELYGARHDSLGVIGILPEGVVDDLDAVLPINIIAEIVDTYVAMMHRMMPAPVHVSVNGTWSQRKKAEQRTDGCKGIAYQTRFRSKSRKTLFEAAALGTSIPKVFVQHGQVHYWPCKLEEWWVDDLDADDGEPTCLYQRRYIDRHRLLAMFPEKETEIEASNEEKLRDRYFGYDSRADQVLVTEAWHLRSSPDTDDGRHVIAVQKATLLDESWDMDRFPAPVLQYAPPTDGFFSQGIVEKLLGPQTAINDLMERVLSNIRQFGKPRIFIERGSRVNPKDFTDGLDVEIIEYTGQTPQVATVVAVPSDVYNAINMCREAGYRRIGIPDTAPQGEAAQRYESSVAIRAASEVKVSRHVVDGHSLEDWRIAVDELFVEHANLLAKQGEFSSIFTGRRYGKVHAKKIEWWAPDQGEEYVIRAMPAGIMTDSISHNLDITAALEARGLISPEASMEMLNVPDLGRTITSRMAGMMAVEYALDQIMSHGVYVGPEPAMPLQLAMVKARDAYCLGMDEELPFERMSMLLQFIDSVQRLMSAGAPVPEPAPEIPIEGGEMQ